MKNSLQKVTSLIVALLLMVVSVATAFADETSSPKAGSTVEYTLSVADSVQTAVGIHFELFYDVNVMKIKDVSTDTLSSAAINADKDGVGKIQVVYSNISGFDCKDKTDLITVSFEVIKEGDTQVQYYVPYFYDLSMVNIYNYTFTQTVAVDGNVTEDATTPILASDDTIKKYADFDRGDFINYETGKLVTVDSSNQSDTGNENEDYETLEYTLFASDIKDEIAAIEIGFIYNNAAVKIDEVVLSSVLEGAGVNKDNYDIGQILVTKDFESETDAPVFDDKTELLTLKFKVVGDGDPAIKYYIRTLMNTDGEAVEEYTFTQTTLSGAQAASADEADVADEVAVEASSDEIKEVEARRPDNNVQIDSQGNMSENGSNVVLIVICVCGVLIIAAIAVLVVVKTKSGKNDDESDDEV